MALYCAIGNDFRSMDLRFWGQFSVAICNTGFEHFIQDTEALQQMLRYAKTTEGHLTSR
jgi:hypothetical protein